jgi:hypothetical protein
MRTRVVLGLMTLVAVGCSDKRSPVGARVQDQRRDAGTIGETYDVGSLGLSNKDRGNSIGLDDQNARPSRAR